MNVLYIEETHMRCEITDHIRFDGYAGGKILWTNEYPAIKFCDDETIDPIAPNGITMYLNNKEKIDNWLDTQDLKYRNQINMWLACQALENN